MNVLSALVSYAFRFKPSGRSGYPCHWCGTVTTLLDAEDFHVCREHQLEYIEIGYDEMKKKYPLAGEDERNPKFFKEQMERYIARAKRLTKDELRLLVQRGCKYEQEYAQAMLNGRTHDEFDERELEWLGRSAEQYIDDWQ